MSISHLVELQDIDTQLEDLNSLLGDLPKMVDDLNQKEAQLLKKINDDKKRLKDIALTINKSESAIAEIDEKSNKLTDQLFLVTNNKQYDALTNEIENLKEKKSKYENEYISSIEEKEDIEKRVLDNEKDLVALKENLSDRRTKLEKALSDTAEEKAELEKSRKSKVTKIDENTIQIYSKVISARSGVAVVSLSGDSCGGCGAALPIQTASEIRSGMSHRCDNCGRFVYRKKN